MYVFPLQMGLLIASIRLMFEYPRRPLMVRYSVPAGVLLAGYAVLCWALCPYELT